MRPAAPPEPAPRRVAPRRLPRRPLRRGAARARRALPAFEDTRARAFAVRLDASLPGVAPSARLVFEQHCFDRPGSPTRSRTSSSSARARRRRAPRRELVELAAPAAPPARRAARAPAPPAPLAPGGGGSWRGARRGAGRGRRLGHGARVASAAAAAQGRRVRVRVLRGDGLAEARVGVDARAGRGAVAVARERLADRGVVRPAGGGVVRPPEAERSPPAELAERLTLPARRDGALLSPLLRYLAERVFDRVVVICSSATSTGLSSGAAVNTSCARHQPGGGVWGDLQPRVAVMDSAALDARFKPAIDYVINAEPHGPARGFPRSRRSSRTSPPSTTRRGAARTACSSSRATPSRGVTPDAAAAPRAAAAARARVGAVGGAAAHGSFVHALRDANPTSGERCVREGTCRCPAACACRGCARGRVRGVRGRRGARRPGRAEPAMHARCDVRDSAAYAVHRSAFGAFSALLAELQRAGVGAAREGRPPLQVPWIDLAARAFETRRRPAARGAEPQDRLRAVAGRVLQRVLRPFGDPDPRSAPYSGRDAARSFSTRSTRCAHAQ